MAPPPVPPAAGKEPVKEPYAVLAATRGWGGIPWREIIEYKDLLYFLVWRDVKVRYKQTLLGAAWALLQPLLTMLIFWIVFGRLVGVPSDGLPYPVFALAALVPWAFFSHGLTQASESLVGSANLVSKVYFPRVVIPLAAVLSGFVDLAVSAVALAAAVVIFPVSPGASLALAPLYLILVAGTALGAGLWLSALNVQYRDVRYTIPFLVQAWFFLSPVTYPMSLIPGKWRLLYAVNPLAGALEGFRSAVTGGPAPGAAAAISAVSALLLLSGGVFYFRRTERTFADVI
jgi:lipopolysaccharide transport system permease protein